MERSYKERIETLNPRQVLNRGYVYIQRTDNGQAVSRIRHAQPSLAVALHFYDGIVNAHIDE